MLQDGQSFCSVVNIPNLNQEQVSKEIILLEYIGMAVDEQQQMLDMQRNPNLVNQHPFTFDYVYGPGVSQETVY